MGVAAVNAPSARAEEPGLVSATRADTDEMNYAINLAGTNPEDLQRALALVPGAGGAALASYPEIGTFFAQSATPSFAPDLAAALRAAGISIHSIGPTRVAPVLYYERVELPTDKKDEAPQSGAAGTPCAMRPRAPLPPGRTRRSSTGVPSPCMRARPRQSTSSAPL